MFWQNFTDLCNQIGKAPNVVAQEVGVKSSGTVTGWKNGALPRQSVLNRIADYFGVTVSDLLTDKKISSPTNGELNDETREELRDDYAYRVLFFAAEGATDADLLEAAALLSRRKEERKGK